MPQITPRRLAKNKIVRYDDANKEHRKIAAKVQKRKNATTSLKFVPINPVSFTGPLLTVNVREFEMRGDGMNAYIVYKLETEVNGVVGYSKRSYETWRRFSDFLCLHGKIVEKYLAKGTIIPQPTQKCVWALTKTKTEYDPAMSREVGTTRQRERACQLEYYVRRLIQHPRMRNDCDVRDFLTIEADLPKAVQTAALSSFGVKKIFKNFQVVFSKVAFHMEEGDSWFEQVQSQIKELVKNLRELYAVTETLVASRREMATSGELLGKAMYLLSACLEATPDSRAFTFFPDVTENVSTAWGKQADIDNAKFSEAIYEYTMLISALKDVFAERIRAWPQWQKSEQRLTRQQKRDLSTGGQNETSAYLEAEIKETVLKMDQLQKHFTDASKEIKEEAARFDMDSESDMKTMLMEYMESMISTHTEMLHLWVFFEQKAHNVNL